MTPSHVMCPSNTSFPLINVRVMATLCIGELYPATLVLALKYLNISSIKSSVSAWFPLKIQGRVPMDYTLAAGGIGTWEAGAAGCPPPPGSPPPPGGPPPPGFPPGGTPLHLRASCNPAYTHFSGVSPVAGGSGVGAGAP